MTEENTAKMPDDMSIEELHEHYSEMLATANDLGFKVPDELLVETEDAEKLREVCAKLDDGITAFRAGLDVGDEESEKGMPKPEKMPKEKIAPKKSTRATKPKKEESPKTKESSSAGRKKPVAKKATPVVKGDSTAKTAKPEDEKSTAPKVSKSKEESTMAKTAKKTPAKKAAKKAAPAKKAAKKAAAPKKSSFPEKAKITVLIKENPCKAGPRRDRVANIMKHHNKSVSSFLESGGREASLRYSIDRGWIKVA